MDLMASSRSSSQQSYCIHFIYTPTHVHSNVLDSCSRAGFKVQIGRLHHSPQCTKWSELDNLASARVDLNKLFVLG